MMSKDATIRVIKMTILIPYQGRMPSSSNATYDSGKKTFPRHRFLLVLLASATTLLGLAGPLTPDFADRLEPHGFFDAN